MSDFFIFFLILIVYICETQKNILETLNTLRYV